MTAAFGFCQSSFTDERARSFDVFVAASGYEARASYVPSQLLDVPATRIVLAYAEHAESGSRTANDRIFAKLGYTAVACSGDDHVTAAGALIAALPDDLDRPIRIGI